MVSDVQPVVDLVVVVERRPLRPVAVVRRHVGDGPPPGPFEGDAERQAIARHELVVAAGGVDPEPRLHRGVRQPADAAERRRGQPTAAGAEARGLQLLRPDGEHAVDLRGEGRSLHRDLAVAFDEHEQDVLAAQAGQ